MESYALSKSSNFKDLEEAFQILQKHDNIRVRLPNSLREKGVFGIEGLVCQFVATWLRNNGGKATLHTYVDNISESDFEDLSSSLYGVCALRLADDILTNDKRLVDPEIALAIAFERVKKVISHNFKDAYKGMYLAIPSIKSKGINREYNNPFYNQENVIGQEGFRKLTAEALGVVVPQSHRNYLVGKIKDSISEIIRELFDNTHKHGRNNEFGDVLKTNFRGVIFNSMDVTSKRIEQLLKSGAKGFLGFASEWDAWRRENNRESLPVLDITVVDAGPGYARRWTKKAKEELSFEEEKEAVVNCFRKNMSTSPIVADGSGLTHVLTDLKSMRGWFRLRTGSVSVSRSFFNADGSIEIQSEDVQKMDAFVEGVSFNIVIPLVDFYGER